MGAAMLALLEALVTSPAIQQAAWKIIEPHLKSGTKPTDAEMTQAWDAAVDAHSDIVRRSTPLIK